MIYKIVIKKRVEKFLSRCDKNIKESFLNKVLLFEKDPFTAIQKLDVTAIVGVKDHYRLRIWMYRFLFINKNEIVITFFDADSRGWIYKQLK